MHQYKCAAQSFALNIAYFITMKKPTIKKDDESITVSRGNSYIKIMPADTGKYNIEVMFNGNDPVNVNGVESDYLDMYLDYVCDTYKIQRP